MKELTVIIPFLNEGDELRNTLRSIRAHSDGEVEIIVINDASTDGLDYEAVAHRFGAVYVRNRRRLGVAASRDLGVRRCETPYFLLLDAHMRFYDQEWVGRIVSELKRDERTLLCCQTKVLTKEEDGSIVEGGESGTFGAFLDFSAENAMQLHWKGVEGCPGVEVEDIPCVLGAGYACSKWYWEHLGGLQGLRSYGCDEAYVSLKVWLEGGRCRLLKKVVAGHIYRSRFPYQVGSVDIFHNQMLIAETLLPEVWKEAVFARLRRESEALYEGAWHVFQENREEVGRLKKEYRRLSTRDFSEILKMNDLSGACKEGAFASLYPYVSRLVLESGAVRDAGLYYGKTGLAFLLYQAGRRTKRGVYAELADELVDDVYRECRKLPVDFAHGICGIGWAISRFVKQGFVEGDVNGILAEVDRKVMERDPGRMTDWSLKTGLGGVLCYVLARLEDIEVSRSASLFDADYLGRLKEAALRMLGDTACREDNRMALAYVAYVGNPKAVTNPFTLADCVGWPDGGMPDESTPLFDLEKGTMGFVLKNVC